jgi:type I restriction enzyme S subunit
MRKYPKYNYSEIKWLGETPIDWSLEKVKFHLSFSKGTNPKNLVDENIGELPEYISVENLRGKQNNIQYVKDWKTCKLINDNDILLLWDGANAGEFMKGKKGVLSSTMAKLLFNKKIAQEFGWYLFSRFEKEIREVTIGMGIPHVNGQDLKNSFVPIPSLPEQHVIVRFLDYKTGQIDRFIANRQKQIELLKEQKAGIINKAVTKGINPNARMKDSGIDTLGTIPENWDVMELKFAAKMMRGKFSHRPRNDERLYGGKFPFIQTGDVTKTEKYITAYKQTLNEWGYSVSKMFPKGTVVITIAANIGDIAILDFDACFPDSIVGFYPKKNKIEYLFYLLKTMKEIFLSESIEGTQLNLSVDRLSSIKVALPEPAEQQNIVDFINEETSNTDTLISKYQKQIDLMQEYRKSLISQAVTGKIDVREWEPKIKEKVL